MVHTVEPKVFLVGFPMFRDTAATEYLKHIGANPDWVDRRIYDQDDNDETKPPNDGELLTEFMSRLCYKSWEPGLNPNVTRVRDNTGDYLKNIIESMHGSVVAHAQYSFVFSGVSRVFTHELLRHQAGAYPQDMGGDPTQEAISQESMRYVRLEDIGFWFPPDVFDDEDARIIAALLVQQENILKFFTNKYGLDNPKTSFAKKKKITSAMRRIVSQGVATEIGWSANIRTIRHCIATRTSKDAETEIRLVFQQVGELIREHEPLLVQDFTVDSEGQWLSNYPKI